MAYEVVLQIYEVLHNVNMTKSKKEKVEILKKYESWALKDTIRCAYDKTLKFVLPEGKPPYTPNTENSAPSSIIRRYKDYSFFIKGGAGKDLPDYKREQMFIDLLESVHPEEALILIKMKDKQPFDGLTKEIVNAAFPGLVKE